MKNLLLFIGLLICSVTNAQVETFKFSSKTVWYDVLQSLDFQTPEPEYFNSQANYSPTVGSFIIDTDNDKLTLKIGKTLRKFDIVKKPMTGQMGVYYLLVKDKDQGLMGVETLIFWCNFMYDAAELYPSVCGKRVLVELYCNK